MEYSGPASIAEIEADLALSDDDDLSIDHWPLLDPTGHRELTTRALVSTKRPIEHDSDASSAPSSPAAKTSKRGETPTQHGGSQHPLPGPFPPAVPLRSPFAAPAFAPRDEYVKLAFKENPSSDVKLRWLSEVTKTFCLDRELAEIKMSAVTSRFVYISRRRKDIIDRVTVGEFLSLHLDIQDSIDRPRKFPSYLITRYPVGVDPSLAKELPGVYTARRFHQNGSPINRLVVTWSLLEPPPSVVNFSFLPCLPSCELRRMKDEQPWCYKCWGIGHISRYCSASEKCA